MKRMVIKMRQGNEMKLLVRDRGTLGVMSPNPVAFFEDVFGTVHYFEVSKMEDFRVA